MSLSRTSTVVAVAALNVALAVFVMHRTGEAQTGSNVNITGISGEKDAVWLALSDNRLVYCWYEDSGHRDRNQATCNELTRWRVQAQ